MKVIYHRKFPVHYPRTSAAAPRARYLLCALAACFLPFSAAFCNDLPPPQGAPAKRLASAAEKRAAESAFSVNILGRVILPGHYLLPKGSGMLLAIAQAGGLADFANVRKVKIVRERSAGKAEALIVDFQSILNGRCKDLTLRPNDTVEVPEKWFAF